MLAHHAVKVNKPLPKLSIVAFLVASTLSVTLLIYGWESTVRFTSAGRMYALLVQAILPIVMIAAATLVRHSQLSMNTSIAVHWFALLWLSYSAFPWYGELL